MTNESSRPRVGPPPYPTRFVGRRPEVAAVRALLRPGRLVTVVGFGGTGKTRLVAEALAGRHAVWVDLSAITGPGDVAARVAEVLGLPAGGGADATLGVVNALRDQTGWVLVLDSCEVQLPECRHLADSLLSEVPSSTVLATSRVPLASAYEWLYPVPPFVEGSELFDDRAARVGSAPLAEQAGDVAELCRRVGGLPLAIELLAAWSHVLSPAQLVQSQPASPSQALSVLPRHRDMIAVLDASMALLTADQRRVVAALGVFAGGFTAEAAEVVAATDLAALATLVERGLISPGPTPGGGRRYRVHELVRSYALARLRAAGDDEVAARRRHFAYFAALAGPWADVVLTPVEPHLSHPLSIEDANLDAARHWALEQGDARGALRLVQALGLFWAYAVPARPRRLERLAAILALPYDHDDGAVVLNRAWACHCIGYLTLNDPPRSRAWFEESYGHFRALGHAAGEAAALRGLTEVSIWSSDLEAAAAHSAAGLSVVRRLGDRQGEAWALWQGAMLELARGRPDRAEEHARRAEDLFAANGAAFGVLCADWLLGDALCARGCAAEAVEAYGAAVDLQLRDGYVQDVENVLEGLAIVAEMVGVHESSARLLGAAATWRAINANRRIPFGVAALRTATTASRRNLGRPRWQAAFDAGARMTSVAAMAFAAATVEELRARTRAAALRLTARERQVLGLVSDGSHDHEVADRLGLSRRTVHAHLRSVYAKLDVSTRTAAAQRAAELGLLEPVKDPGARGDRAGTLS